MKALVDQWVRSRVGTDEAVFSYGVDDEALETLRRAREFYMAKKEDIAQAEEAEEDAQAS